MKKIILLFELLEYHKVFISPRLTPRKLAIAMNTNLKEMEKLVFDNLGISLKDIISLYRVQHSRQLLMKGVDFCHIPQFSGFRSMRRFRNCLS